MVFRARPGVERAGSFAGVVFVLLAIHCAASESSVPAEGMWARSAGVFIGVEDFPKDPSLTEVRYAVNDAVDLAYALSVEHELLPASRVLLLLSREPGEGSAERLATLLSRGARRSAPTQADIYSQVEKLSGLVDEKGIFVLSIATHGYAEGGDQFLLTSDSLFRYGTGITAGKLLEATAASRGLRLLIIDACREQLSKSRATGGPDPRSAMRKAMVDALTRKPGYAVLSAASPGGYAYPGERNGLFTGAILEGLRCQAPVDGRGFVTLKSLEGFVREKVETLSRGQQRPELRAGGGVDDIALVRCGPSSEAERIAFFADDSTTTVYRTPKGEKYHRADCQHVRGKAIPLSLEEAARKGLAPCKTCHPPPLPAATR